MSLLVATSDTGLQDFGRQILEEHFSDYGPVLLASDSNSAIQLALTQQPDLILLTVGLPASGLHVARTIWNERAETKIIFWALIAEEASIREVMHILPPNAVYGYLLRTIGKEDLINSIRSVLVGNQCILAQEVQRAYTRSLTRSTALTDTEHESLIDITLGLTDQAIAQRRFISRRAVTNRLKSLYEKLGVEQHQCILKEGRKIFSMRTLAICLSRQHRLLDYNVLMDEIEQLNQWLEEHKEATNSQ